VLSSFRPGQLVTVNPMFGDVAAMTSDALGGEVVGSVVSDEVALVVATPTCDGSAVLVFNTDGLGWVSGGLLKIVFP